MLFISIYKGMISYRKPAFTKVVFPFNIYTKAKSENAKPRMTKLWEEIVFQKTADLRVLLVFTKVGPHF